MPRLSVIIPHQGDDVVLESTILSVLENKPQDSEVIVVHDGSYRDPYHLQDELLLVQVDSTTPVGLLNAGVAAAKSPVVCLLCDGATVSDELWADAPLRLLQQAKRLFCVAVRSHSATKETQGISLGRFREQAVFNRSELATLDAADLVAPTISCGFYRRQTLIAVGGWDESMAWSNADIEMAMRMHATHLVCGCVNGSNSIVSTLGIQTKSGAEVKQLAALASAYGLRNDDLASTLADVLRGALKGKAGKALSWATGLRSFALKSHIQKRCSQARTRLLLLQETYNAVETTAASPVRRAA